MSQRNNPDNRASAGQPAIYQIRLNGHLGSQWSGWFDGLTVTLEENGVTLLTGLVVDQAALHGLLRQVRDIGLPLVSLNRIEESEEPDTPHTLQKPRAPDSARAQRAPDPQ